MPTLKYHSFFLSLCLIFFGVFISQSSVSAKPASLVLKQSFGSDPYTKIAMHENQIIVTGKQGAGDPNPNALLDILEYQDQQFQLRSQYLFRQLSEGKIVNSVIDVAYFNHNWLILVDTQMGSFLLTIKLTDNHLEVIAELDLEYHGSQWAELVLGQDNHLYIVDKVHQGLVVKHLDVKEDGSLVLVSKKSFGTPSDYSYSKDQFAVAYQNNTLYLTNNQKDGQAVIYRLTLDEQGIPLDAVPLRFDTAQAEYRTMAVKGDYLFLSYVYWGFQVVKMDEDGLHEVYNFEEDSSFSTILFYDNFLVGADAYGEIEVFNITDMSSIQHVSQHYTSGFLGDGIVYGNTLFVTKDSKGIEALALNQNGSLTTVTSFSQSGEISDFTQQGEYLATSAMDSALNIWALSAENKPQLTTRFELTNGITGLHWQNEDFLLMHDGSVERHRIANILANIDEGEYLGRLRTSGRDGQILPLQNGYVAKYFDYLSFFSSSFTQLDEIEVPSQYWRNLQPPLVDDNVLYVPVLSPGQVIIYDTSDLVNVHELGRIDRGAYPTHGNLAKKENILYVPSYNAESQGIAMYDVTDKVNPLKVGNIDIVNDDTVGTVVHVDGNFLLVLAYSGYLFDISNPGQPVLIDENPLLSSNGTSAMFDGHLYAVPQNSAGHIQDVYVNLAPQLEDMTTNLDEDTAADITLPLVDAENDVISYSIITPPELGLLDIVEAGLLRYTPATDFFGVETAQVQAEDQFGGSSTFVITLNTKAINDAPQLVDSVFTTLEDQMLVAQIQASDVDSESLLFELLTTVLHGEVTLSESGELSYTPRPDFFGVDKLEVKVSDELHASSTKFIDLAVTPVNDLPTYTGETTILGDEDTELNLSLSSVDIEGDLLEYSVLSFPDGWTVAVTDNSVVISPSQDDNGTFTILLGISDGTDILEQSINVVLNPVNDAPATSQTNLAVSVVSGSQVSATLAVTDIDNDALTYVLLESASKGTVTLTDSGFSYQSNAGHVGSDTFIIRVSDTAGEYVDVPVSVNTSAKVEPANTSKSGGGSMNMFLGCLLLLIYLSRLTKHQVCYKSH